MSVLVSYHVLMNFNNVCLDYILEERSLKGFYESHLILPWIRLNFEVEWKHLYDRIKHHNFPRADTVQREDLAAGLLKVWTNNFILECESIATAEGCSQVFFQGGFTQNATVRKQITEHVTSQNMYRVNLTKKVGVFSH